MYICIYTCIYVYIHIYIYTCTCICICICMCICIYIYIYKTKLTASDLVDSTSTRAGARRRPDAAM